MNKLSYITIILIICLFSYRATAQNAELDSLEIAEAYLESENFNNAIRFYRQFLMQMPDDPELNFKMGFSLLNTSDGKEESIEYFEKATKLYRKKEGKNSVRYIESSFYLARAYRSAYRFKEALDMFEKLRKQINNRRIKKEIDKEIKLCENGIDLTQEEINVKLTNLGKKINSKYSDHSPVVSADESVIIFTSRRPNESGGESDMDGRYDEDIFISHKQDSAWTKPEGISKNINSPDHEASIGLSVDGQKLFIYKPEDEGSIYLSDLEGLEWGILQKLGPNINTRYRETHASLSADGRYLYFTSDRPGGLGGMDIYVSEMLPNGTWGPAKNPGDAINTELDEESPYIHPDGKTLYFSSEGHKNLGGFDVFKAEKNQFGTFSKAQNLGYPVNTVQDDVFYLPTADGKRAYYASKRKGGLGDNDLYMVTDKSAEGSDISVMVGYVYTECTEGLPQTDITLTNNETGQEWYYAPNSNSGKFVFVVNRGESYSFEVKADEQTVFTDQIRVPEGADYQQEYKSIRLDPHKRCDEEVSYTENQRDSILTSKKPVIRDENGEIISEDRIEITESGDTIIYDMAVTAENILFDTNSDNFKGNETTEIIAEYLKNNPGAVIEVGGYSDAVGNAKYNHFLSYKRAYSVKKLLLENGAKDEQITIVAYGEENPIAYNKTNGYFNYKTLRFNRRVEFRVLKQGETTLRIKPITVLPEGYTNPNYKIDYEKKARNDIETKI
jgi:outer membrane protein OmpA-like peptidoglycan-associated protein/tetratricopeptide (TPR) repeat protein